MDYQLIRSRRKTLAIEISRDAKVIVRAPMRLSRQVIEQFLAQKQDWIEEHLQRQLQRKEAHPEPDEATWQLWKRQAKEYIPRAVAYYAKLMGVTPTAVRFSRAKTRFGSCSSQNSITFSLRLMDYPREAIDYVVVHELAHIRHKNHSREFYFFVARVMPDYQKRAKLLKQ